MIRTISLVVLTLLVVMCALLYQTTGNVYAVVGAIAGGTVTTLLCNVLVIVVKAIPTWDKTY